MSTTKLFEFLNKVNAKPSGNGWTGECPVHGDTKPSLSINKGDDGKILFKCHADDNCTFESIVAAVDMKPSDFFPSGGRKQHIEQTYDYCDATGNLVFQVVRYGPKKTFSQRRPDGSGGWINNLQGIDSKIPYRLTELLAASSDRLTFIAEGEKDVDRLAALNLIATCNSGGAAVASKKNPNPQCKWKSKHSRYLIGRPVAILADNDPAGNDHATGVAKSLIGTASSIKMPCLPGLPEKGDVSDWIGAGGAVDELLALVESTPEWTLPPEQEKSEVEKPDKKNEDPIIKRLADQIIADDCFAKDEGGMLYRYHDGAYRQRGAAFIRKRVKRLCIEWDEKWSTHLANEVVEYIGIDAPELWESPPTDVVNVVNGLLNLVNLELSPHTPNHLTTIQLPVTYDAKATCPAIDKFISEVFPKDAVELAYESTAELMAPNHSIQKALLYFGAGGNGKSVWLGAQRAFLGGANVSAVSLHRLESCRFSAARIVGKLANICADLPSEHLEGTSNFKAITGGDPLLGERKHAESFEFVPFCKLVFSANSLPRSQDSSDGFFDRWIVIPFDARFRGTDREVTRQELDARLSQPSELSGLLNKAIKAWQRIQKTGRLSEPESVCEAWREFHAATDPLAVWLDRHTIDDPSVHTIGTVLRVAYGAYCERSGRPPMTDKTFTPALIRHRPSVIRKQRTVAGKVQWCYVGIGLSSNLDSDFTTSPHSPDHPICTIERVETNYEEEGRRENDNRLQIGASGESGEVVNGNGACSHDPKRYVESKQSGRSGWITTTCGVCGKWMGNKPVGEEKKAG